MGIENWIRWYRSQGIKLIPLKKREKVPALKWGEFKRKPLTDREEEEWLARGTENFGAICGSISNDLLVIDVDREELFPKLGLRKLASETFTVRTRKGYHLYFRMPDPKKKGLAWKKSEEVRFQGEGKYVVCAGSKHPSGAIYEHFNTSPKEIKRADPELLDEIKRRWEKYHGIDKLEEKRKEIKTKTQRSWLLEDFKRRVRMTSVIEWYVSKVNDYGTYWQGHCPFHNDRQPSFTVFEDTRNYYCFGCGQWGDVITFIMKMEERSFMDAITRIEGLTGEEYFRGAKSKDGRIAYPYPLEVEELIVSERDFVTLRDTEEVLQYENTKGGAWRFNGKAVIKEETEKILKKFGRWDKRALQIVSEVIGHVQRSTYIDREQLNTEKKKINLLNGVYDLENEQLLPHDAGYYFTYLIPVWYQEQADCPKIKKFLGEILPEDDIKTMLQFIGYCMIPVLPYHQSMMFLGEGANGKSTMIELIRRFLGEKNTCSHSLQSIIEERFTKADLYGRLANLYADIPRNALYNTSVFKVLTGGDMLSAEKKFKEPFSFKNTAKLIFSANVLPQTLDDTDAFFRRWLIINFPNRFEGERCDPKILEKLTQPEELSGFLNMVLSALKQLLRDDRFHTSKTAAEIREEYIDKSNPVRSFVTKCLELDSLSFEAKDDVYSAFIKFCKERKLPEVDKRLFGVYLPRCAPVKVERKKIAGKRIQCWRGIKLKDEKTFLCQGCGAKCKSQKDFMDHAKGCDEFQMRQAPEPMERR